MKLSPPRKGAFLSGSFYTGLFQMSRTARTALTIKTGDSRRVRAENLKAAEALKELQLLVFLEAAELRQLLA